MCDFFISLILVLYFKQRVSLHFINYPGLFFFSDMIKMTKKRNKMNYQKTKKQRKELIVDTRRRGKNEAK